MNSIIRPYSTADYSRVLEICISAFTAIHEGFEQALGADIFRQEFGDWKKQYADQIQSIAQDDPATKVYVAEHENELIAFIFTIMHKEKKMGEIGLNAVDPARQGQGIGKLLYEFALRDLRERGATYAYVGTGSDAAHAPARAAYQAVGFNKTVPSLHYYKSL